MAPGRWNPLAGQPRQRALALTEPVRAAASAGLLAAGLPLLALAPRGERHPVLVLPGLLASDTSTAALRGWVRGLGYPVVGWDLGRNRGPTEEVLTELPAVVQRLADRYGTRVSIIGQSLGGIYARRLALRSPDAVRQVTSLGSPFAMADRGPDASPAARVYRGYSGTHAGRRTGTDRTPLRRPLPVPSTSVYSRYDGVVDWRACLQDTGPTSENVAVRAAHLGMGVDPAVLWVVADRLAQTREEWRPFRRPTRFGLGALFPEGDDVLEVRAPRGQRRR